MITMLLSHGNSVKINLFLARTFQRLWLGISRMDDSLMHFAFLVITDNLFFPRKTKEEEIAGVFTNV